MRLRVDPFVLLLLLSAAAGIWLPATGVALDGVTLAAKAGVVVLFFLHGLRLPTSDVLTGLSAWRVHLVILGLTFVVFPLLGLALQATGDHVVSATAVSGFVFLCLVPSTVQSSVALTSIAGGDRAIAVVAASLSSLVGVLATPALVSLLLGSVAHPTWGAVLRIVGLLLVPFLAGQLVRPAVRTRMPEGASSLIRFDQATVLFIVYVGFCNGTNAGVWSAISWHDLALVVVLCALTYLVVAGLALGIGRSFGWERAVAVHFAGTTKSLTAGLPMALILFPHAQFGLMILPLMIYHLLQLVVGALLARRWSRSPSVFG